MEKKVNWQICRIKGQELADELKGMANDVERVALVKEILDTKIGEFIVSKTVARVYLQELLDEFICEGDGVKWAVIAYRISFFVEFMKGSRVKKVWSGELLKELYEMSETAQAREQNLLSA